MLSRFHDAVLLQRKRLRDGKTFQLPPLGKRNLIDMVKALRAEAEDFQMAPLYGLTSGQANQLAKEGIATEPNRDDWDYVYLTKDLAELPGDKYHPKRNFIARCLAKYKCEYVSIGSFVVKDCLQIQTQWCSLRNCSLVSSLEAENTAMKTALENREYLGVSGGAVYVDGKLEAFTLAEPLNSDTAVIHFEKANPQIEGLYQVINQWFCQEALSNFEYVNREQDLGIPGLRKAKQSYHPHHMVEKHTAYIAE